MRKTTIIICMVVLAALGAGCTAQPGAPGAPPPPYPIVRYLSTLTGPATYKVEILALMFASGQVCVSLEPPDDFVDPRPGDTDCRSVSALPGTTQTLYFSLDTEPLDGTYPYTGALVVWTNAWSDAIPHLPFAAKLTAVSGATIDCEGYDDGGIFVCH